jgi:arylsulfatase A-like enzyme
LRAAAQARPNLVLVVLDDLDTGALVGLPRVEQRLAREGLTFTHHFVSNPLCCPSRASLLTGLYTHNHGVRSNALPEGGFGRFRAAGHEAASLAAWLHAAGYRTGLMGKYLNDYPHGADPTYVPPGWDDWHAVLEDREADNFGYWVNDNGRVTRPAQYQTDFLSARALAFIDAAARRPAQPFFLYIAPAAPHAPSTPAPRHVSLFATARAPRTASFNEADVSDKPTWLQEQPLLDARQLRRVDRFYRRRLQTLAAVDEAMEQLFARLEGRGLLANTFVFFTSDNGYLQGQHRFPSGKNAPYEESVRVPLLVRGPGVAAGARRAHLVANLDCAPTLLELAGLAVPTTLDGRSFAGLLSAAAPQPESWRQALLLERQRSGDPFPIPAWRGVRTLNEAYFEYESGERETYDLRRDPEQLDGRMRLGAERMRALAARLDALGRCRGRDCF